MDAAEASLPATLDAATLDGAAPDTTRDAMRIDADAALGDAASAPPTDAALADSSSDAPIADAASKLPALADQTPPGMSSGIVIDESGYLWVANGLDSQLLRLEPPGEKIVERYGPQQGIEGPDDLIIDPEAIYYTASLTGNVNRLDRKTGRHSLAGKVGTAVNPIARLPSGMIVAGIAPGPVPELGFLFTGLFEVDPAGVKPTRNLVKDSLSVNAFCVGPDGMLYAPALHSVVKFDLTTGQKTTLREGFGYSAAVRYSPRDGLLYVLDVSPTATPNAPNLHRMKLDGSDFTLFAHLSDKPSLLYAADNFAIAPDGTLYVTRLLHPIITRVSPDGRKVEDFNIGQK